MVLRRQILLRQRGEHLPTYNLRTNYELVE